MNRVKRRKDYVYIYDTTSWMLQARWNEISRRKWSGGSAHLRTWERSLLRYQITLCGFSFPLCQRIAFALSSRDGFVHANASIEHRTSTPVITEPQSLHPALDFTPTLLRHLSPKLESTTAMNDHPSDLCRQTGTYVRSVCVFVNQLSGNSF